jgi:rhamnogalacturonyl hydrolase YesR
MSPRPRSLLLALALGGFARLAGADDPGAVLALMERAADWQLAHPKPDAKPTGWVNAAFYCGVLALARDSASPRFHDAMVAMGEANGWRLGSRPYHADDQAIGQVYAELFLQHRDPRMIAPLRERLDFILAHPKDDNLEYDREKNPDRLDRWSWCDALFMAPPAWIRLWQATGDRAYLDYAVAKWWVTSDFLYDRQEHLFSRDSTMFARREPNGAKVFWSRGNGWVLAGLARVLDCLPAGHPARPRFEAQFRELAARVLACQQDDGFWRPGLLDPASHAVRETSGTGFFCSAFAWGVRNRLLERDRFAPAARRAWAAIAGCVTPEGRLTHVQPVGNAPEAFPADWTEPYGVGALLLAGSEIRRLGPP